ncbi:MAG: hypothetical protein HKN57_04895 [Xanthomonadales bacterium]|nr:hypothetical protein [Gammaproteobacteria bacterium]MBT8053821.1 hypothetical protein [Gammaproteobacteria bacterium]NND56569.1 hypothetical protein [Xanthomonadales bacterium]NNK52532.1 hypothetical protein [Xanthomonadales bacterium]
MKYRSLIMLMAVGMLLSPGAWAQEGTWLPVEPMPTARESVAACTVDEKIYAIGGFPGRSARGIKTNERYDLATNSWTQMTSMPTGRRMPVTGVVDGKCYVIGGRIDDGGTPLDNVEAYDPKTDSWTTHAPMPTARFAHAAAVVDGIIYVIGGTDGGRVFRLVEAYNPATGSWTTRAPMSTDRALHGATVANGKIYVMGGAFDMFTTYASMEIYDPVSNSWSAGPDMPLGKFSLSAATLDNRIYAIGGTYSLGSLDHVVAFDPGSRTWAEVAPMNTRRVRFASAVAGDQIYAIGGSAVFGGQNHVGMQLVERYNPASTSDNFGINAGMSDAWFNPLTNGQGFLISVFPQIGQMFVAWFTYDIERPADDIEAVIGEPGHRWLTAQGPYEGDTAELTIYQSVGGVFDAVTPAPVTDPAGEGTMTIEFADCDTALLSYELTSLGLTGEIPIQRIVKDNVQLCETLISP